ncbi:hypothetical protein [Kitasatospora herbaricolor]|uniref:hypothetical protein n=1 Tax=Kitasatospora herbaricolor TaxID=68217 RepID=UPI0036DDD711
MTLTTIKVQSNVRDELAHLAADELGGVTLGAALEHLLTEHRKAQVLAAYTRLHTNPEAWADYQSELNEWDTAAAGEGPSGGEA